MFPRFGKTTHHFLNIYFSAQDSTNEINNKEVIGIVDIISISSSYLKNKKRLI